MSAFRRRIAHLRRALACAFACALAYLRLHIAAVQLRLLARRGRRAHPLRRSCLGLCLPGRDASPRHTRHRPLETSCTPSSDLPDSRPARQPE